MEQDEIDDGTTDLYYSADSSAATVEIEDPTGETETEHLPLDHRSGSRWRVEKPLSAPALTPRTLPEYGVGALRYFGWNPLKAGLVPGLILAVLLSVLLPDGVSVAAIVGVVFLTGLLRRAPQFHSDVLAPSAETVVDERSASD